MYTKVKTDSEITAMRHSGQLLAAVLNKLHSVAEVGMTTADLNELAKQELRGTGGSPAFLGYYGFPGVLCVSVNDEVVHGIPNKDRLIDAGDIVSLDFGVTYDGMITDSALSFIAGSPRSKKHQDLIKDTEESLQAAIAVVKNGVHIGDIGHEIEAVLKRGKYGVVRDLVGHGVGHNLHEEPNIPNQGKQGTGPKLASGMTVAIEPMATLGDFRVTVDNDHWTVRTIDGSLAAHFEHTILVTDYGCEVLTRRE